MACHGRFLHLLAPGAVQVVPLALSLVRMSAVAVAAAPTAAAAAALSLVAGFAVAQATGIRALGGVVLVVAVALCERVWRELAGTRTAVALVGVYLGAFVLSHLLALVIGAWPSVVVVAVVVGVVSWRATSRSAVVPG